MKPRLFTGIITLLLVGIASADFIYNYSLNLALTRAQASVSHQLQENSTTGSDILTSELSKFHFPNSVGQYSDPLQCKNIDTYNSAGKPRAAVECTRRVAIIFGVEGKPGLTELETIASQFHQNGWRLDPYPATATEADEITNILLAYRTNGHLNYEEVDYKKSFLQGNLVLATNDLTQPIGQNFCDEFCEKVIAN